MDYDEYSENINDYIKSLKHNGDDNHFLALEVFKKAEELKSDVSKVIYLEYINRNALFFARHLTMQTQEALKINEYWLNDKPLTNDFKTRYEAIRAVFIKLNTLPLTEKNKEVVKKYEEDFGIEYAVNSKGCYIATMVYGSYSHPQVLILRNYRDNILKSTVLGRIFIRIYYFLSPKFVYYLKGVKYLHNIIKIFLDSFVSLVKDRSVRD